MKALIAILLLAAMAALGIPLFRFNRKRRHIARCVAASAPGQLEGIYACIDTFCASSPGGYVLARGNAETDEARCLVPVPEDFSGFPWSGKVIEVTSHKEVEFHFVDARVSAPTLLGRAYRIVPVPRHKGRNIFSPRRLIQNIPALRPALSAVCPAYPEDLLSYLLCAGSASFEFDPINQARIGLAPAWIQSPEKPRCDQCGKPMRLILQLPGTVIHEKLFHNGTFYLFGCPEHPRQTRSVGQCS
ncbi:MAG: hypothetical protein LBF51_02175 [Zoogloeaceae bacterium]|jgi:hypothetical protein|nr:hypothetical protein [Zoogloeaceae bacterium]